MLQRASVVPTSELDNVWRRLTAFEIEQLGDEARANAAMKDLQQKHTSAKTVCRDRKALMSVIQKPPQDLPVLSHGQASPCWFTSAVFPIAQISLGFAPRS